MEAGPVEIGRDAEPAPSVARGSGFDAPKLNFKSIII
jgi:hypothetical protein